MKKIIALFFWIPLCSFGNEISEEYINELRLIQEKFVHDKVTIDLEYNVYLKSNYKLIDHKMGKYEQAFNNYRFQVGPVIVVQNQDWVMYLDESDQLILVKESEKPKTKNIVGFDLAIEACETIERSQVEGIYRYDVTFKGSVSKVYSQVSLFVKKSDLTPQKICFEYAYDSEHAFSDGETVKDKMILEVIYTEIRNTSNAEFATEEFFVVGSNDQLVLTEMYKKFTLVDHRLNQNN